MKNDISFFLGTNSGTGFHSLFYDLTEHATPYSTFIIKGGPGTGKSGLMKKVAEECEKRGLFNEKLWCSSDPDSLDAVILPDKKMIILDGTAPHTVDPSYPGVCEKILNFGEFWRDGDFYANSREIIELTLKNKALHASAARYLRAAGQLISDNYKTALACTDISKTEQLAARLCKRLIPIKKNSVGREWARFIGGITPKGINTFTETAECEAERLVIISDRYGSASNIIINAARGYALAAGYEIITLKNPFLPSLITDHVIIPELKLAFVTENDYAKFASTERRVHSRRFVALKKLHLSNERMKFNRKAAASLLESAAATLQKAKSVHDELEAFYIGAMDFKALDSYYEGFLKNI